MYRVAEVELEKDTRTVERLFFPSFGFIENNVISYDSLWAVGIRECALLSKN